MRNFLLTIYIFIAYSSYSQDFATVDSLLNSSDVNDTSHIHGVVDALLLAKKLNYDKGIVKSLHRLGYIYTKKDNNAMAMEKYMEALFLSKQIGNDEETAAISINLAFVYHNLADYDKEIGYALEALSLTKRDSLRCYGLESLGKAHMAKGNFKLAVQYFSQSIAIKQKRRAIDEVYKDFSSLGNAYIKMKQFDSAVISYEKIETVSLGRSNVYAHMYNNLGVAYHLWGNFNKAEEYYLKAIQCNDREKSGSACLNYAELLHAEGDPIKANRYLQKALTYYYDLGHLHRTLYKLGLYKEAYVVSDCLNAHRYKDYQIKKVASIEIAQKESEIINRREKQLLKTQYESERKIKFMVILISILVLGLVSKYVIGYFQKETDIKRVERVTNDILKKHFQ